MIVVAVAAGGDNQTDEVATGTPAGEPGTESSPPTAGDTIAPTGGAMTTTAPPPTSECDDPVVVGEVLGRRDLDADGVDELFATTGSGTSTDIVGVFRVEGCRAVQVTMGGSPAESVGAAVLHIDGLQVGSDMLVVYSGTGTDGEASRGARYDWIATR